MDDKQVILSVKGLCLEFSHRKGAIKALRDISFDMCQGEILGVVGESGAGKSLTGSAIMGLLDDSAAITAGEIVYQGQRIDNLDDASRQALRGKEISAIFQDPLTSLNPVLTIEEQLTETILTHLPLSQSEALEKAIALLEEVGIAQAAERIKQYPHQFSGGMRQRIVIALALCVDPFIVIADEPTTALDVSVQSQVLQLLKRLCKQHGTTVMLVTHDMGVIAEVCDRVAVMYAGEVVEIGKVHDIVKHPQHPYTVGLMDSIPRIGVRKKRLSQISGSMPRLTELPCGCKFHPRCQFKQFGCDTTTPCLKQTTTTAVACLRDISIEEHI
ncbi:ABC transporter ATP-binding protein [Aliagarivorans taiwanensis]|uniref:ABC transporter ATP-binding protein n=1 Tax=Aliagarivorans taiwanensis TaxID=561966 RepID=UPI00040B2E89|nr:ABC transporter ATP-binding protein [Aliagarivorans taiwanensis]